MVDHVLNSGKFFIGDDSDWVGGLELVVEVKDRSAESTPFDRVVHFLPVDFEPVNASRRNIKLGLEHICVGEAILDFEASACVEHDKDHNFDVLNLVTIELVQFLHQHFCVQSELVEDFPTTPFLFHFDQVCDS